MHSFPPTPSLPCGQTRIETDPADLSQLRLTVASSDPSAALG